MKQSNAKQSGIGRLWEKCKSNILFTISVALVFMLIVACVGSPYFLTAYNLQALMRDLSFVGMMALAMSLLLIIGELDLSVGSNASLSGVLGGMLMVEMHVEPYLAFLLAVVFGTLLGALNGVIISKLKLNPMVATIGMSNVYGGIVLAVTKGRAIPNIPEKIHFLGKGDLLGIPIPFVICLVVMAVLLFFTKKLRTGRYAYAMGNSIDTAAILGISTERLRILLYSIVGCVSALCGMLYVARLGSAQTNIGSDWAMNAIAASVIGGVALTGGIGNPLGALLGAAIICIIQNVIVLFGVNMYIQSAVSGIIVILAISFSSVSALIRQKKDQKTEFEKQKALHNK